MARNTSQFTNPTPHTRGSGSARSSTTSESMRAPSTVGCLTASKYGGGQFPDQAAVMSGTNHLWLNVRGDALDCGMPSTKKDDYKGNAPVFTWYYPDKNG